MGALAEEIQLKGLTGIEEELLEIKKQVFQKQEPPIDNIVESDHKETYSAGYNLISDEEMLRQVETMMEKVDDKWICTNCQLSSNTKSHMKEHAQLHMNLEFPCDLCGKITRSSKSLKMHIKRNHKAKI